MTVFHVPHQTNRPPAAKQYDELRRNNGLLNIAEFEAGAVELQSLPMVVFMELTQNCNLKCPYCRSAKGYAKELDMPLPLFQQVAQELFPTATLVDLRGWGESTILKSFGEIVQTTASYGPHIRLVTNAMNPSSAIWDPLMAAHATVVISCDAADPELFELLRRGGNLERLKNTVRTIVRLREHYGVPADHVYFTTVVCGPNIDHLPEVLHMAYDLGLPKVIFFPIICEASHPWHLSQNREATRRGLEAAHETAAALNMTIQLGAALDDTLRLVKDIKSSCMHPWAYALIDYAGRVGFCDHLIGKTNYTFGSLYEESFRDIWNGQGFRELRAAHLHKNLPDRFSACRFCYKMRYVDFEHQIYPSYNAKLVTNETRIQLYEQGDQLSPTPEFFT